MNTLRILASFALLGVLHAPVHAQFPERPQITPSQTMSPEMSELPPNPLLFGEKVTRHDNLALIWEREFALSGPGGRKGRVAVFTRNSQGIWVRSASIDPRSSDAGGFGQLLAIFNNFALIKTGGPIGLVHLYQRVSGKWKLMQILTPPSSYSFTALTIWNNWAFIGATFAVGGLEQGGAVFVYQFTSAGTLRGIQTLRSYSGNPVDRFARHVAVSNGRVLVSAYGDSDRRGAAYVFELSGSLFVKRQKLIAINGAAGDEFATDVGISGDWIAIGAPKVSGPDDDNCFERSNSGAIYVFKRINGTWLQQDALTSGDARDSRHPCVNELGQSVVISGNWIAAAANLPFAGGNSVVPIIYKRDTANFTPRADAQLADGRVDLHLSNGLLLVGSPVELGCPIGACNGHAFVYELEKAGL